MNDNAGRWFPLAEALEHWGSHAKNRTLTMALMQSAIHIARLQGWKFSGDPGA